jgi:hypothetical protein
VRGRGWALSLLYTLLWIAQPLPAFLSTHPLYPPSLFGLLTLRPRTWFRTGPTSGAFIPSCTPQCTWLVLTAFVGVKLRIKGIILGLCNGLAYPCMAPCNCHAHNNEASFLPSSIDSLCLRVAQVPRFRDMVIFVSTDIQTDRRTNRLLYPLLRMRACGVINAHGACTHYTPQSVYLVGWAMNRMSQLSDRLSSDGESK